MSAATDAIGAYHFTLTSMGRKRLPEIATGAKRPRNDTSGSAKVHQRPCTVELPRTGRSAGLSPQLIGLKILKYCAAVGGFAALRMRHAPCGYTKYSCNFQTSIWNKIPRWPLLQFNQRFLKKPTSSAGESNSTSAPCSSRNARSRKPHVTERQGRPEFFAVIISTSESPM